MTELDLQITSEVNLKLIGMDYMAQITGLAFFITANVLDLSGMLIY